jgi:hypothetical protein
VCADSHVEQLAKGTLDAAISNHPGRRRRRALAGAPRDGSFAILAGYSLCASDEVRTHDISERKAPRCA